jgi:hypothetical protein
MVFEVFLVWEFNESVIKHTFHEVSLQLRWKTLREELDRTLDGVIF